MTAGDPPRDDAADGDAAADPDADPADQLGLFAEAPPPDAADAAEPPPVESEPEPEPAPPVELELEPEPAPPVELEPVAAEPAALPSAPPDVGPDDLLAGIVGQPAAVAMLRAALATPVPAYLFTGPSGAGIRDAACRFAGELLTHGSDLPATQRRLALAEQHPDLVVFDRVGPALSAEQAREAVRLAATAPASGQRKVLVVCDLHTALTTASILLKAVEEPSPTTVFVLLTEQVAPHLSTLQSRCVRIDFAPLDNAAIARTLEDEGAAPERAAAAASAGGGSIERARLLAADDAAVERIELWRGVLGRVDGSGGTAAKLADELLAAMEAAAEPLREKHDAEMEELRVQAEAYSLPPGGSASDEARRRRELRRHAADEMNMGLAVLTEQIRVRATAGTGGAGTDPTRTTAAAARLAAVCATSKAVRHNANLRLALHHLLLSLTP